MTLRIVRDMWLTGFDVPCLHTMYIDKPMRDHNLMQAIARVNRVFRDKEGGLVVDHIGIAAELRSALRSYTESKGKGVEDIFKLAGLERPNIGILSDAFLEEVRQLPQKNFAVELLQKLLNDQVKSRMRTNVVLERGDQLSLSESELAFYDALADNESAQSQLGDEVLKKIAVEITEKLRNSTKGGLLREFCESSEIVNLYRYGPRQ